MTLICVFMVLFRKFMRIKKTYSHYLLCNGLVLMNRVEQLFVRMYEKRSVRDCVFKTLFF